jgi:hypothetical protein
MIRVERDPAFWTRVASHPACAGALFGMAPEAVGQYARQPLVLPMAAEHGGFLFTRMDVLGFTCELHTLFTPEGWGREALMAGMEALNGLWLLGYQSVVTFEVKSNPRSRPPKTFGFTQGGDWRETPVGEIRQWVLTRAGWEASAAGRRTACQ